MSLAAGCSLAFLTSSALCRCVCPSKVNPDSDDLGLIQLLHISVVYRFYMPWGIWSIPIEVLYMLQNRTVAHSLPQWQRKAGEQTPRNSSGTGCLCLGSWVTSHICAAYNRNLGPGHMKADAFKAPVIKMMVLYLCSTCENVDEKDVIRLKQVVWHSPLFLVFPPPTLCLSINKSEQDNKGLSYLPSVQEKCCEPLIKWELQSMT